MTYPTPAEIITAFNDALNRRDIDAMMALMTPDCVFENTYPPPDGERLSGQAAVRRFWEDFLTGSASFEFVIEALFAAEDQAAMRWTYRWIDHQGRPGHIRGVDVYRLCEGLIAEKLSYVKG